MRKSTRALLFVGAAVLWGQAGAQESLLDVYQRAVQNDPTLREAEARYLAATETPKQARAALLPQISASASADRSSNNGSAVFQTLGPPGPNGEPTIVNQSTTFATRGTDTSWSVSLRQSVFRWDQWLTLKQADKRSTQAEVTFEAAKQDLMLRVAQAYFDVLAAEDTLSSAQASKEAIGQQLDQAQNRFDVGLIAITDVQEAQAAYDQASATVISAQRALSSAREQLRAITGTYIEDLASPRAQLPLAPPVPADADQWVDMAMQQNLDLMSARLDEAIAADNVDLQRADRLPQLDLSVSHNSSTSNSERSNRGGPFSPSDSSRTGDTISLNFSIPIFTGGGVSSRIRQAVQEHRASREAVERVSRETERSTRDAYLGVTYEISNVQALRQAVASAQTALDATQAGYDVGTRTSVDVLNARQNLFQAQTNYARARYDYLINVLTLNQAAGTLEVQDLESIDALLQDQPTQQNQENQQGGNSGQNQAD